LRAGETLSLRTKDVDPSAGTVTVLHGKGDRRRVVGLDPGAMSDPLPLDRHEAFPWYQQSCADVLHIVRQLPHALICRSPISETCKQGGDREASTSHGLRHTNAYELMVEGVPVPIIQ
jgi:integrase